MGGTDFILVEIALVVTLGARDGRHWDQAVGEIQRARNGKRIATHGGDAAVPLPCPRRLLGHGFATRGPSVVFCREALGEEGAHGLRLRVDDVLAQRRVCALR